MSLTIPATTGTSGMRLKKAVCQEKLVRSYERVWIKNGSDISLRWTFMDADNEVGNYEMPPGTQMEIPARMAWNLLGDPDLRPGQTRKPTTGGDIPWKREVERLMHLHGAWIFDPNQFNGQGNLPGGTVYNTTSVWHAIKTGKIWCTEIAREFGRGEEYYSAAAAVEAPRFVASIGLTPDEESSNRPRAVVASKIVASPMTDDDTMIAVPKSQAKYA